MHDHPILSKVADILAGVTIVSWWMSWLPPLAAGLSCIWLTIQIGEWIYRKVK